MKKLAITALATLVLTSFASAFAQQTTAEHQLQVTIPDVLMIRILTTDAAPASVVFDYAAGPNQAAYFAALEANGGWLIPTGGNLQEVEVLAIGSGWTVDVTAGAFATAGLTLADVRVTPSVGAPFFLNAGADVATGLAGGGWTPLGISNASYALFVDGDEAAGSETITVTYSIFAN